ncbi:hypothetical protein GCM10020218_063880 [Dactylosporangium vinaceum]
MPLCNPIIAVCNCERQHSFRTLCYRGNTALRNGKQSGHPHAGGQWPTAKGTHTVVWVP